MAKPAVLPCEIITSGDRQTLTASPFSTLALRAELRDNLDSLGYRDMTPIQALALPPVLAGRDLIARARTGSGKTAAFGLGLLNRLDVARFRIQTLVLCPTRELADQVAKELRRLARRIHNIKILTLCGGVPIGPQIGSLEHGAHVIVGTPGRVGDHLRKGSLRLDDVTSLVLDEADRMLEMGFQEALDEIIGHLSAPRQTLLFSATYPPEIESLAARLMIQPLRVETDEVHDGRSIRQGVFEVEGDDASRLEALRRVLLKYRPQSTLVFCTMRREAQAVADELCRYGFSALPLHGDLEQRDRDRTLERFTNRSLSVLVATDVAARGLDIEQLDAVINYHLARDDAVHVHRVGRTGRAGHQGVALSFCGRGEKHRLERLEAALGHSLERMDLPGVEVLNREVYQPPMVTLQIDGGRKQKVRAGDIVGALTAGEGLGAEQVGRIRIADNDTCVAVSRAVMQLALDRLGAGKVKGRSFRARWLR